MTPYRGRLAPSPTGDLHIGHARTFWTAYRRSQSGELVLRNDDLDGSRSREEFWRSNVEDLEWLGIGWHEGPDLGGPVGPYRQSERMPLYGEAFERLREQGLVYVCRCSRKQIAAQLSAPHQGQEEPVYPGTCRDAGYESAQGAWRFRVPDGESVTFHDGNLGAVTVTTGVDFGDFHVMRADGVPSYQLACTVDDALMRITEVVRGADLVISAARQLLLYRALGWTPPAFFHCPLVNDLDGNRLAKRTAALSIKQLRGRGLSPREVLELPVERLLQRCSS